TKRLSSTDSALAVLFWMSLVQTPISLALAVPQWVNPVLADLPWLVGIDAGDEAGGCDGGGADRLHPPADDRGGRRAGVRRAVRPDGDRRRGGDLRRH